MAPIQIVNTGDITEDSVKWARRITRLPRVERLVAIGDFHGDYEKAKQSLKLAKVMDDKENWIGGKTVVVQMGDILDRGDNELDILFLLEKLQKEAIKAGGQIITLLGNHEIMNMEGNFSYVNQSTLEQFDEYKNKQIAFGIHTEEDFHIPETAYFLYGPLMYSRISALKPGGPVTKRFFGNSPAVLQIGSTVFVHAGLKAGHVEYGLERINRETRDWLLGRGRYSCQFPKFAPHVLSGNMRDGILYMRNYSIPSEWYYNKEMLDAALSCIPRARRLVVGHTPQDDGSIMGYFDGKVYAVDVGMSKGISDSDPEVLQIVTRGNRSRTTILTTEGMVFASKRKVEMPNSDR